MKKAIAKYDELGNPIGLVDVKDFRSEASYKSYLDLCALNKTKADKRAEEKVKAEAEAVAVERKRTLRRCAWIARLWFEHLLDNGALVLSDEEYQDFIVAFNGGDVDEAKMPEAFLEVYGKLKGEDL